MDLTLRAELHQLLEEHREDLISKHMHPLVQRISKPLRDPTKLFRNFELLSEHQEIQVTDQRQMGKGKEAIQLLFIETTRVIQSKHGSSRQKDTICVAAFPTKADWGRSLIRPESFLDKLAEFFSPCEHDFEEYREFSSKFCCFSNDVHKLRSGLSTAITQLFLGTELPVAVEFGFGTCVIRTENSVLNPAPIVEMAEFAMALRKLIV